MKDEGFEQNSMHQKNRFHQFPRNTHNSKQLSTSPHSEDDGLLGRNYILGHSDSQMNRQFCSRGKVIIKLKIYCIDEDIQCCGDRECIEKIQDKLSNTSISQFTKICIQLLLFKKLAKLDAKYLADFQATLAKYQRFQQNFI